MPAKAVAKTSAAVNPYAVGGSDLGSLFDELTETDLQPIGARKNQGDAEHGTKDPLAQYSTDTGKSPRTPGSRPVGLTILSVLNFLIAIAAIALGALIVTGAQFLGELAEQVPLLKTSATIFGLIIIAAGCFWGAVGVGLLVAKPWGWWLAITVYAYNFTDRVFSLVFGIIQGDVAGSAVKGAIGIGIAMAVLGYLYNEEIRAYYGVKTKPGIAAAITIGGMTAVALAIHLTLHLMAGGNVAE